MSTSNLSKTTIKLNDGTSIPWIAFGTGTALYNKPCDQAIVQALQGGFTSLDAAQIYNNEDSMGKGINDYLKSSGKSRKDIYITTKLNKLKEGQTVLTAIQGSLDKLFKDSTGNLYETGEKPYVDLFLIHAPQHFPGKLQEIWKEMEEVKASGLTKSIGVSNFHIKALHKILATATVKPAVNQIEFHPLLFNATKDLLKLDEEHGIVTASFGGLTPIFRDVKPEFMSVISAVRSRLERTRGKPVTEGQVILKWLQYHNIMIVTTTSKKERIEEYLDAAKVPDLTPEEAEAIGSKGSEHEKRAFGGIWEA